MGKCHQITYYRPSWLIDGSGGPVVENGIFSVKNRFFHNIFNLHNSEIMPENTVDMSGYTVLPCFIDAHVHLAFSGTTNFSKRKLQLKKNCANRKDIIITNIRKHLSCGVVAVRDAGDPNNDILKFKKKELGPDISKLTILSSGKAWYSAGRYGGFIGQAVKSPNLLAQSIWLNNDDGRDHLKIINSGLNSLVKFGSETSPQFKTKEIKFAVNISALLGKKIMVHANGSLPVKYALDAFCHSIEHGFFMGKSNLILMAQNSVVWVPTVLTMKTCLTHFKKTGWLIKNILSRYIAAKNLEHQLEQISFARKNGVTIALGTDAGSPGIDHGYSIKEELQLLVNAGYTLEEAIMCATKNGARLIGCNNIGLIAKGMKANFLAVRAKPSQLISALDQIDYIFIDGKQQLPPCN